MDAIYKQTIIFNTYNTQKSKYILYKMPPEKKKTSIINIINFMQKLLINKTGKKK